MPYSTEDSSNAAKQDPSEREQFPLTKLPTELQLDIWDEAAKMPRVLWIWNDPRTGKNMIRDPLTPEVRAIWQPLPLSQVCHTSRVSMSRHYRQLHIILPHPCLYWPDEEKSPYGHYQPYSTCCLLPKEDRHATLVNPKHDILFLDADLSSCTSPVSMTAFGVYGHALQYPENIAIHSRVLTEGLSKVPKHRFDFSLIIACCLNMKRLYIADPENHPGVLLLAFPEDSLSLFRPHIPVSPIPTQADQIMNHWCYFNAMRRTFCSIDRNYPVNCSGVFSQLGRFRPSISESEVHRAFNEAKKHLAKANLTTLSDGYWRVGQHPVFSIQRG